MALVYMDGFDIPHPTQEYYDLTSTWARYAIALRILKVVIHNEVILPIFADPITPETYKVTLEPLEGRLYRWVIEQRSRNSVDIYATVYPTVNVGTIGHVDYKPLLTSTINQVLIQRSGILHPGHASGVYWQTPF